MRLLSGFRLMAGLVRAVLLKLRYGSSVKFLGRPYLRKGCTVTIRLGGSAVFHNLGTAGIAHFAVPGGSLKLGDSVYFNHNATVTCRQRIEIGDHCLFGPNVCIFDHDHRFGARGVEVTDEYTTGDIIIGKDCWFGSNVTILKNTYVGDGCVIGAGVVLKGNIPPHSLVTCSAKPKVVPLHN